MAEAEASKKIPIFSISCTIFETLNERKGVIMPKILEGKISAEGFRFAIVVSRFNEFISSKLVEGAMDALNRHGADDERHKNLRREDNTTL
jgi:hypothetical protein